MGCSLLSANYEVCSQHYLPLSVNQGNMHAAHGLSKAYGLVLRDTALGFRLSSLCFRVYIRRLCDAEERWRPSESGH